MLQRVPPVGPRQSNSSHGQQKRLSKELSAIFHKAFVFAVRPKGWCGGAFLMYRFDSAHFFMSKENNFSLSDAGPRAGREIS